MNYDITSCSVIPFSFLFLFSNRSPPLVLVTVMSPALQSFLRAYTTYPAHLKHIFHIRSLHLGHTAKSFGLRDAPQGLSAAAGPPGSGTKSPSKGRKQSRHKEAPLSRTDIQGKQGKKRCVCVCCFLTQLSIMYHLLLIYFFCCMYSDSSKE